MAGPWRKPGSSRAPLLVRDAVTERADGGHRHFDHITGLQIYGWVHLVANAGRSAGRNDVARLQGREAGNIFDQIIEREQDVGAAVVLAQLAIDPG